MTEKKATLVGVAPPTTATPAKPRLPLPTGAVHLKKLSPLEQRRLQQLGWNGQSDLPENFVEIAEAAFQAASGKSKDQIRAEAAEAETADDLVQELQQRAGRSFQKVAPPTELDISELPPDQQASYRQLLDGMLKERAAARQEAQELAGLPDSVASAIQEAGRTPVSVVDDRKAEQYASGADKPAVEAPRHTGDHCARCGYPKDQFYDVAITEEEKDRYLEAALHLQPLETDVKLFGDRLQIRLRALAVDDNDDIWRQLLLDEAAGYVKNVGDKMEYAQRYRLALALIRFETAENITQFPGELARWNPSANLGRGKLWDCWVVLRDTLKINESMYRVLAGEQLKFATKLQKMEQLADSEGFWKAGGTS